MTKWLRYDQASKSKPYKEIANVAAERLTAGGSFQKEEVLEKTGYAVFDDIRWDYIKRMIEEEHATELVPLAGVYFQPRKSRDRELAGDPKIFPARYIATGHGKKTAGYAIASEDNGHFVVEILKIKTNRARGMMKAAETTREVGSKAHVKGLESVSSTFLTAASK